jgi:hypothetical protein
MEIVRKSAEVKKCEFPTWKRGKVVEVFHDDESRGLYIMAYAGYDVLISLSVGNYWSPDVGNPFDGADYAIEVTGKFVEE